MDRVKAKIKGSNICEHKGYPALYAWVENGIPTAIVYRIGEDEGLVLKAKRSTGFIEGEMFTLFEFSLPEWQLFKNKIVLSN